MLLRDFDCLPVKPVVVSLNRDARSDSSDASRTGVEVYPNIFAGHRECLPRCRSRRIDELRFLGGLPQSGKKHSNPGDPVIKPR